MKKNYLLLLMAIFLSGASFAQEVQKSFINYQGLARNSENQLMANESMTIGIALKMGNANEAPLYSENHTISTDANGVFSLKIGNGDTTSGDFGDILWGSNAAFVTVSINGSEIGTTEMMAVPYALSSGDAKQSANEVPYDNTTSGLSATNTQEAIDALVGGGTIDTDNQALVLTDDVLTIQDGAGSIDLSNYIEDADADINNELQTLSFDTATNELSLSDGNTVIIPSGGTDADADPMNEIQSLAFDAGTNELSLSGSNTITIPTGGVDADADPTNELQNLSFDATTNELSLSNGNAVTIPTGGTDADADPTNEIQDISLAGTELSITDGATIDLAPILPPGGSDDQNLELTGDVLSIEGGTGSVDLSTYRDDADADSTNELQTISFDAATNELSLTDGGSVTIPSGGTDADADPTNELQDISLAGTELSITDGSTIDLAPIIPPGGSDDQNLILTGDELSIESGTGSIDLSTYRDDADADPTNEVDVTAQAGILLGDGSDVTGLMGTADGQVPKWDIATSSWIAGTDATGSGGSSLWVENVNGIQYNEGAVALGNTIPSSDLHVHSADINSTMLFTNPSTGTTASDGLSLRLSGINEVFGFNAHIMNNEVGNLSLGTNGTRAMTLARDAKVGIGMSEPKSTLEVAGGQWDLDNTDGDFRIGDNSKGLRIGVATGNSPGGGDVRLRAQGGTNRLFIGAGNQDVMTVTPNNVTVNSNITVSGEVNRPSTGAANMVPIAYGTVAENGTIINGSGNFTVTKSTIFDGNYSIDLNNGNFSKALHTALVTRLTNDSMPGFITAAIDPLSSAIKNTLIVITEDKNGLDQDAGFSFVVYSP